jgi:hypothetical protein
MPCFSTGGISKKYMYTDLIVQPSKVLNNSRAISNVGIPQTIQLHRILYNKKIEFSGKAKCYMIKLARA